MLKEKLLIPAITVFVVIVGVFCIVMAIKHHEAWEDHCVNELGGRVEKDTKVSSGTTFVNGKAQPTTTTSTTYYCLSDDGGILDIE